MSTLESFQAGKEALTLGRKEEADERRVGEKRSWKINSDPCR